VIGLGKIKRKKKRIIDDIGQKKKKD